MNLQMPIPHILQVPIQVEENRDLLLLLEEEGGRGGRKLLVG
jgi:hypothetical protein